MVSRIAICHLLALFDKEEYHDTKVSECGSGSDIGLYIISYYIVSGLCLHAEKNSLTSSVFKKNATFDIITSVCWVLAAIFLLWSLVELCITQEISLGFLVLYYFFFIFLFAFSYGLLEWHFPGMLEGVHSSTWTGELLYLVLSVQTQTTLGYTSARPARPLTEVIACMQALLGLFFCVIFIARSIALMVPTAQ